jgi:fucose 4-O-acetylase-like acetyltransferase
VTDPEPRLPSTRSRNVLIDALRFVAIAMVVLTHVLNLRPEFKGLPFAPELVRAMMSFNMPLFAFVSGYVLRGREGAHPVRFIKAKALALLVPYLAWIALEAPLRRIQFADVPPRLVRALYDPLASFQMWFLLVLFVAFAVFALSRAVSDRDSVTVVFAIVVGLSPLLPLPQSNLLSRLAWLYPFVVLGFIVAHHRPRLKRYDVLAALAGLIAFPLLFATGWDGIAYRFAIGLSGMAALWGVFRVMPVRVLEPLGWLGQRTMGVYGWQMVVLPYLIVGAGWPGALVSWVLVTAAAVMLTLLLERFAFTRAVFLGRWPRKTESTRGSGSSVTPS